MKLNFRKGFLRLIVVLSILFAGTALFVILVGDHDNYFPYFLFILAAAMWVLYYVIIWIVEGFTTTKAHDKEY